MNSSLYTGATGMKGLAEGMHVTTNNLANVSTIGFKQQDVLFSDVLYQTQATLGSGWGSQEGSYVAMGQVGMGLQIEAIRTKYEQGTIQSTNSQTDLAINGKGFFQVTDGEKTYYTRAGDFITDNEGVWRTPSGLALNGYKLDDNGERTELGPVQVDTRGTIMPSKTTSGIDLTLNLNSSQDLSYNSDNPFFGLLGLYDASKGTVLDSSAYSASQTMTVYDAEGNARNVTAYFDAAPSSTTNRRTEFIIADDQIDMMDADGNLITPEAGAGLLMSGILEFDSAGNLVNIAAFTPQESGNKNLENWIPAQMLEGNPAFTLSDGSQMSINFGLTATGGWENAPENAAQIGADPALLPGIGDAIMAEYPTTAYASTSMVNSYKQNGYAEGVLSNVSVSTAGVITGYFSNGQNQDLWEIPLARFTSEAGLYREGGNLFSATAEAGQMELGGANSENYGEILAYNIENSNVDMAQEMVNMIITQRGFQSNSKVVTTADEMLRKAMELKRQ